MTGSSKTTTSSNSEPWKAAQPALKQGIGAAQNLFNSGTGAGIYTGNTFSDPSQGSIDAAQVAGRLGYDNVDGRGISGQYQGVIGNYGQTGDQRNAVLNYYNTVGSGGYNDAQNNALANTRAIANGSFNINEDPGFKQVIDQATNSVNGNASAAGRYGSGTNQQLLGSTIGDLGARQFSNWQARKDAANSNLFNMGQTGQANVSSALGNIANIGQQGFNNLGAAYSGMQAPLQNIAQYGQFSDDYNTKALNDKLRIFNDQQNRPWEQLSRLQAIASGAGQLGGSQTQSQPGQNPFLTALGYGATGAGLLGGMF